MQIYGVSAAINLEAEEWLRIESRNQVEIACVSGLLWVTQAGDARDLFVASGESVRLVRSRLTLVSAIVPSMLRAREVPPAAGRRAWPWPPIVVAPSAGAPVPRVCFGRDRISSL